MSGAVRGVVMKTGLEGKKVKGGCRENDIKGEESQLGRKNFLHLSKLERWLMKIRRIVDENIHLPFLEHVLPSKILQVLET